MLNLETLNSIAWRLGALSLLGLAGVQVYSLATSEPSDENAALTTIKMARAQEGRAPQSQVQNGAPDPKLGPQIEDIWKPAATPPGGTSWALLEAAKEVTRTDENGYVISYPLFTREQRALEGKRIKVSGWMDPLQVGSEQKRFVLLGYPPGCPFHFHAAPMQFIEVMASTPFETDRTNVITVSGVLELTGYDESGVFYRLWDSRPG